MCYFIKLSSNEQLSLLCHYPNAKMYTFTSFEVVINQSKIKITITINCNLGLTENSFLTMNSKSIIFKNFSNFW